ncbi:Srp72p [Coemansia sp. RSA 2598]|nr:Srp72p [Coemansia sp. RSA 2598]
MEYEAAYCYFMLGRYEEAKEALKKAKAGPANDRLMAQIAYKCNRFSECVDIYSRLISATEHGGEEHKDLLINLAAAKAADAQMQGSSSERIDGNEAENADSYELMFNAATKLLAAGQAEKAIDLLRAARELARSALSADGWTEHDIQGEIFPIEAQIAVALHQLGRTSEARDLYRCLLASSSVESNARDVVRHNAALLAVDSEPSSAVRASGLKRFIQVPGSGSSTLSQYQRALMMYNMVLLHLARSQVVPARRLLKRISRLGCGSMSIQPGLISAAVSLRAGEPVHALNELSALAHSCGAADGAKAVLAAAQTALGLGEKQRALSIVEEWLEKAQRVSLANLNAPENFARYYFGTCMLASWLSSNGRGGAEPFFSPANAAKHLQQGLSSMVAPSPSLLAAVGDCLVYSGSQEDAKAFFGRAIKTAREMGVEAGDLRSAHIVAELQPGSRGVDRATDSQDVARMLKRLIKRKKAATRIPGAPPRLVRRFQPRPPDGLAQRSASGNDAARRGTAQQAKTRAEKYRARRQRKLRNHPPKNYDPERKPDSERWIPLRQRSYYKPRGRGGRQQQKLRGSAQGGVSEAGAGLGGTGSARIAGVKVSSDAATAPAQAAPDSSEANKLVKQEEDNSKGKPKSKVKGKGKGKGKGKRGGW